MKDKEKVRKLYDKINALIDEDPEIKDNNIECIYSGIQGYLIAVSRKLVDDMNKIK